MGKLALRLRHGAAQDGQVVEDEDNSELQLRSINHPSSEKSVEYVN